ncbi:MAG: type II toxin-antitoxin system HicA family toxin [Fibromonadaceae bacterium]|nr:type II toxin-antitoxin system HicA family toxin [Fibromonadaceae bacterium]
MKRNVFLKHLKENGCTLKREGSSHSWYVNMLNGNLSSIPRHSDINEITVIKICKQLRIPVLK